MRYFTSYLKKQYYYVTRVTCNALQHWLSAYVEVDSSLFVSERICGVRCRKLLHYSVIPFILSLSAYSELTEIKTFTGINLAQSFYV